MSRTVDERVVSMQFDNRNFERNAKESMSTLDKLKQKLNLSGAAKGLNEVDSAAKKVNFNPLGNAVESVKVKFSAFEVMAVTALTNITNKAVNAGEQLLKSLTIDNVTAGWSKYEQKTASVQTILNATGKSIDEVNAYLDKLMWFSDETSYGFTDMTKALATMTSAGGDIDKLIPMIMGVANATAFAGKGAAEFSQIMQYGINQAYSLGHMQVRDWQSIENATVGSKQLKEILIQAAEELGKIEKGSIAVSQFRETLADKWLDKDVMEAGFGKFAEMSEKAFQMVENGEVETASEAYEKLSAQYSGVSIQAAKAAQEAKTFTEAIDATKDAVSSGWMKSFEIIFGNYEKAKELWTDLANFLWDVFASGADRRNEMLDLVFNFSPWDKIKDKLESVSKVTEKVSQSMEDLSDIVNRVINGEFGNTEVRWEKLTEMGYDWIKVQNKVNETLGCSYRRQEKANDAVDDGTQATEDITEAALELNDAMLKEIGLTEEEIEVFKKLQEISKRTGIPLEEINGRMLLLEGIKNIGKSIIDVFKQLKNAWSDTFAPLRAVHLLNIIDMFHRFSESLKVNHEASYKLYRTFKGLCAIIDLIVTIAGGAFRIAFTIAKELLRYFGLDVLDVTAAVGDAIVKFRNWLKSLIDVEAIVQVIGPLIARAVDAVRSFIKSVKESKAFQTFADRIRSVTTAIREWFAGMKDAENLPQYIANGIGTAIGYVLKFARDLLQNLVKFITGGFKDIPGFMADGFIGGLGDGIKKVAKGMIEFGRTIINRVKEVLGIHSPSKVFFAIGGFVVTGFILGFRDKIGEVWPALGELLNGVVGFFESVPWGKIFANVASAVMVAFGAAATKLTYSMGLVLAGVASVVVEAGQLIDKIGDAVRRLSKAVSNSLNAMAFKQFAISIAILVGAIVVLALVASQEGMVDKIWMAVVVIFTLAVIMGALFAAMTAVSKTAAKVGDESTTVVVNMAKMTAVLLAIGGALLMVAAAFWLVASVPEDKIAQGALVLGGLTVALIGLMAATRLLTKKSFTSDRKITESIDNIGRTLKQVATALLTLAVTVVLLSLIPRANLERGMTALTGLVGLVAGLMLATRLLTKKSYLGTNIDNREKLTESIDNVGKTIKQIANALLVLVAAVVILSWMDPAKLDQGIQALYVLGGLMAGLMLATRLLTKKTFNKDGKTTQSIDNVAMTLLAIAGSLLILTYAAGILGNMSTEQLTRAFDGFLAVAIALAAVIAAIRFAGGNDLKSIGATLLGIAAVIGVMALVVLMLSGLNATQIAQGVIAIGVFGLLMMGLVKATKDAKDVKGTMIGMAIAIGVMAAALAILSFIEWTDLIAPVVAMGVLMAAFALMASQAGKSAGSMGALIVLTVAIAVMTAALVVLAQQPIDRVIGSAIALGVLMAALALVVSQLGKMGGDIGNSLKAVVLLVAVAAVLYILADVFDRMSGVQNALINAVALTVLMTALCLLVPLVSSVGEKYGFNALKGVLALAAMAVPLIAFVGVLAAMSGVQNALSNTGVLILLTTAMALLLIPLGLIGSTLGFQALIGVLALAAMAVPLIAFVGVLAAMSGVQNALSNALALTILATAMTLCLIPLALVGAAMVPALLGAVALTAMAVPLLAFVGVLAAMSGVQNAIENATALTILTTAMTLLLIPLALVGAAMVPALLGAVALTSMAVPLLAFVGVLSMMDGMENSLTNALALVTLVSSLTLLMIPLSLIGAMAIPALIGVGVLTVMAASLGGFGKAIASFSNEVAGVNVEAVRAACEAGKAITEMASTVPNQGGIVSWFAGDNSLATFGPQIASFGKHLKSFSDNVSGINPANITAAAEAGKNLAKMADTVPNQGGIKSWFSGDNSIAKFGSKIAAFGVHLKSFSDNVSGVNTKNIAAAAEAGKNLAQMASTAPTDANLGMFGVELVSFGKSMASFAKQVSGIKIDGLTVTIAAFKDAMKKIGDIGKDGIDGFIDAFKNAKSKATAAATELGRAALKGVKSVNLRNEFYTTGKQCAEGFASGISANTFMAKAKAAAMAQAALEAARAALRINSPSKVFRDMGMSVPEGFAMGIDKLGGMVKNSAVEMADGAIDGTKTAIARIADAINSDIDTQPTIRPVLDLSDIQSGANALSGMLAMTPSVGVMANVGAISSMMNNRQNGGNDDVVSALNDLKSSLSGRTGDSYTINGITYDDGTNVSTAVKELVRAARIERRV